MARPRTFSESKVLEAVQNLFWEQGYSDTSYRDLEEATGLKRTSLYAAFGDKDALYQRALQGYQQSAIARVKSSFEAASSPLDGIRQLLQSSIENATASNNRIGCFLNNAATERNCHCPTTTEFVSQNRDTMINIFQEQLEKAKAAAEIKQEPNTRDLSIYLFSLYNGLMSVSKTGIPLAELQKALDTGLSILSN